MSCPLLELLGKKHHCTSYFSKKIINDVVSVYF